MTFDLLVKNATLPDGREGLDIAIAGGRIVAIDCDLAVAQGLLAIRSHVDVCDDRLLAVDALLEVKRQVAPYLDLQLVAFPQDGYYRSPGAAENLRRGGRRGRRAR